MLTKTEPLSPRFPDTSFSAGDAILDILTSGRYWRTSRIQQMDLITRADDGPSPACSILSLACECEEDEFQALESLAESLAGTRRIITFNGHSFDLPYLRQKYKAYRLDDPFEGKEELDLYHELKKLVRFFAIPSGRLSGAAEFLNLENEKIRSDAETELEVMSLLRYRDFLDGKQCEILDVSTDEERLIYTLSCAYTFPREISVHDTCFHMRFSENGEVLLSARIENGNLRCYHTDLKNYEYLPAEGYAVHRSAAAFVDKARKENAARETCFHLAAFTEEMLTDRKRSEAYLRSVLEYLKTR